VGTKLSRMRWYRENPQWQIPGRRTNTFGVQGTGECHRRGIACIRCRHERDNGIVHLFGDAKFVQRNSVSNLRKNDQTIAEESFYFAQNSQRETTSLISINTDRDGEREREREKKSERQGD